MRECNLVIVILAMPNHATSHNRNFSFLSHFEFFLFQRRVAMASLHALKPTQLPASTRTSNPTNETIIKHGQVEQWQVEVEGSNPGNGTAAGTGRERKWREKDQKL